MKLSFDEVKATQAAALFLKLAKRPLNYTALIKLLYKADREAIRRWGLPITTDKYSAMKLGPVTSRIYNRIKDSANPNAHPTFWAAHIRRSQDPHEVELGRDPGDSELSPIEEKLIAEIFSVDGGKDPGDTSAPIDISDIVAALGLTEEEAAHVANLVEVQRDAFDLAS